MQQTVWERRDVLRGLLVMAGAGVLGAGASLAAAQQVKYSSGTEPAKLKAPANAFDCHHHIYGSQYKVDPHSTLRPGDATVDGASTPRKCDMLASRAHVMIPASSKPLLSIPSGKAAEIRVAAPNVTVQLANASAAA